MAGLAFYMGRYCAGFEVACKSRDCFDEDVLFYYSQPPLSLAVVLRISISQPCNPDSRLPG